MHTPYPRSPPRFADDAALIVTELGANALVHTVSGSPAGGAFHLSLTVAGSSVTITVTDHGGTPTTPKATPPDADATHGRGLALVEALASRIRIHGDERGHTVTAELTAEHDAREGAAC